MEAWQLLQGNIPSVMGGGATGNSSPAPLAKDVKQNPDNNIPKAIALITFFILNDKWVGENEFNGEQLTYFVNIFNGSN